MNFSNKIHIDINKSQSLVTQLEQEMIRCIRENIFPDDLKIPSSLKLAKELSLSAGTIEAAMRNLAQSGYLKRGNRGSFVCNKSKEIKALQTIAVIFSTREEMNTPYKTRVLEALSAILEQNKYRMSIKIIQDYKDSGLIWWEQILNCKEHTGIIMDKEISLTAEVTRLIEMTDIPIVLFNSFIESNNKKVISIVPDFPSGIRCMLNELIKSGHSTIATINRKHYYAPECRKKDEFLNEIRFHRLDDSPDLHITDTGFLEDAICKAVEKLLSLPKRPTAIMCFDDIIAFHAIRYLQKKGIKVPEEISVTGFNDLDICKICTPQISTVAVPFFKMALLIVRKLQEKIMGSNETGILIVPTEIKIRESIAFPCN